jgi:transcriptional regulator with XRE-family HTH domain
MRLLKLKISKVLASNLIALRECKGLTVIELSKLLGVTRQGVYHLESGEKWISLPMIEKLSSIYKIEQHELFLPETKIKYQPLTKDKK